MFTLHLCSILTVTSDAGLAKLNGANEPPLRNCYIKSCESIYVITKTGFYVATACFDQQQTTRNEQFPPMQLSGSDRKCQPLNRFPRDACVFFVVFANDINVLTTMTSMHRDNGRRAGPLNYFFA